MADELPTLSQRDLDRELRGRGVPVLTVGNSLIGADVFTVYLNGNAYRAEVERVIRGIPGVVKVKTSIHTETIVFVQVRLPVR